MLLDKEEDFSQLCKKNESLQMHYSTAGNMIFGRSIIDHKFKLNWIKILSLIIFCFILITFLCISMSFIPIPILVFLGLFIVWTAFYNLFWFSLWGVSIIFMAHIKSEGDRHQEFDLNIILEYRIKHDDGKTDFLVMKNIPHIWNLKKKEQETYIRKSFWICYILSEQWKYVFDHIRLKKEINSFLNEARYKYSNKEIIVKQLCSSPNVARMGDDLQYPTPCNFIEKLVKMPDLNYNPTSCGNFKRQLQNTNNV